MNVHVTFTPQDQNRDSLQRYITAKILHIWEISVCKPCHATLQLIAVILWQKKQKDTVNTNYKIKEEPYRRATTAVKRNAHH